MFKHVKRLIVKIGTSTLTHDDGKLNIPKIRKIADVIAQLMERGYQVVLVTSGAIGAGMGIMDIPDRPKSIAAKQALAAIGQVELIQLYQQLFKEKNITVGQLLLTKEDFVARKRYLNARNVCHALIQEGVLPIINENDSIVANEIKVGDNDTLSALVAGLIDADVLVIMSDIDGLYDKNPTQHADATLLNKIASIDDSIFEMAGSEGSKFGSGGMYTKIIAADMATKNGTHVAIVNGNDPENINILLDQANIGTLFLKQDKKISARKYWLAYGAADEGVIIIDSGAETALKSMKSLLPVGVTAVKKIFEQGAVVTLVNQEHKRIAKGITNYSSSEIEKIKQQHSNEIENILGYKYDDVIIHIDNLIFL